MMLRTCLAFTQHSGLVLVCTIFAATIQAQETPKNPSPPENSSPSEAIQDASDSPPLGRTTDGEARTFDAQPKSSAIPRGDDVGEVADEYSSLDRGQSKNSEESNAEHQEDSFETPTAESMAAIDPSFKKFVDLSRLQRAMEDLDAATLLDIALALADGEKTLHRTHHSGITADSMISKISNLALRTRDEVTVQRLALAAKSKKEWQRIIENATEFASASRSPSPQVSLDQVSAEYLEIAQKINRSVREAYLTNDRDMLQDCKNELKQLATVSAELKAPLIKQVDSAMKAVPEEADITSLVLREFGSASRALPRPGDRRTRTAFYLSVRCGNTGSDSDTATYQPDPGWVILDFKRHETSKYGIASSSISYVQANSRLVTSSELHTYYREAIDGYYQEGMDRYAAAIKEERNNAMQYRSQFASSHRALVGKARARGKGPTQGGSSGNWTVTTKEMYIGSSSGIRARRDQLLTRLGSAFRFRNNSNKPIRLALRYRKPNGNWITDGWWSFGPGESSYLATSGNRIRTKNNTFYYYAKSTVDNWHWSGNENRDFRGERLPMEKKSVQPSSGVITFGIR